MVFALVVVTLVVITRWRHGQFDWRLFASTLLGVRWPWLLTASAFALLTYYGRALRWAVMIRHLKPRPSLWGLLSATAIGFAAIVVLGRPGELVRPYMISVKEKLPLSTQLAAWLLERICDLLSALLIFGLALMQVDRSGARVGPRLQWALEAGGWIAAAVGMGSIAVVVALRQFSEPMQRRMLDGLGFLVGRWRARAEELLKSFVAGMEATRNAASLWGIFLYTLLEWGLILLCYLALLRSFPALAALRLTDVLILIGFVAFGSLVQIPGVGGGVQVVSIVVLTEIFKVPLEAASGMALVIWIVTFVVIVPIGLLLAVREGLNWHKIREMKQSPLA
ncbi:MAG: lysylphosphatidylglycerol synthase transmembrane domain-containing protein [Bryobacteraceae bacterium]